LGALKRALRRYGIIDGVYSIVRVLNEMNATEATVLDVTRSNEPARRWVYTGIKDYNQFVLDPDCLDANGDSRTCTTLVHARQAQAQGVVGWKHGAPPAAPPPPGVVRAHLRRDPPCPRSAAPASARARVSPRRWRRKKRGDALRRPSCSEQRADACWHPVARRQNDFTSRGSLHSMASGASIDTMAAANAAAMHSLKAGSCLTHLMAYFGAAPASCCAPTREEADEVAARMRRSMSSRGQDVGDDPASHAHGGQPPGQR
jgi:hypothetical protein